MLPADAFASMSRFRHIVARCILATELFLALAQRPTLIHSLVPSIAHAAPQVLQNPAMAASKLLLALCLCAAAAAAVSAQPTPAHSGGGSGGSRGPLVLTPKTVRKQAVINSQRLKPNPHKPPANQLFANTSFCCTVRLLTSCTCADLPQARCGALDCWRHRRWHVSDSCLL